MSQEELKKRKKHFPKAGFEPVTAQVTTLKEGRLRPLGHPGKLFGKLWFLLVNPRQFLQSVPEPATFSAMYLLSSGELKLAIEPEASH